MTQNFAYRKGFAAGYNNPESFDQEKLLQSNSELAQGVAAGILQRNKDNQNNCVEFRAHPRG